MFNFVELYFKIMMVSFNLGTCHCDQVIYQFSQIKVFFRQFDLSIFNA